MPTLSDMAHPSTLSDMIERMLHLLPAPVHRLACKVGFCVRNAILRRRGGTIYGCSILARNAAGHMLLVRHSYGPKVWAFPGGGLRAGEDPHLAAHREFSEELGGVLCDLVHLGQAESPYYGTTNVVHLFTGLISGGPSGEAGVVPDGREIIDARFFSPDALPPSCSKAVMRYKTMFDIAMSEGRI